MKQTIPLQRLAWRLAALFFVVAGAKLWLIQGYGVPIPYLDQWMEIDRFFKPWAEGHLTWAAWFEPHNEHRIFFTRLLDLLCIQLNGEWDPLLQVTVNALFHAAVVCAMVYCLWVLEGQKDQGLFCILLAPFFALPLAAENTLWGFQSQFYFMLAFGGLSIFGLGFHQPGSKWWLLGLAAAVFSLFTMASGVLASLAIAGLMGLRWLKERRFNRENLVTVGSCLAVFVIGMALVAKSSVHASHSLGSAVAALAWILAWPFENKPTMLLFTCLPLGLTTVKYFKGNFRDARAAEFLLTLGIWGFLQSAALAYGRTDMVNCSRYTDIFNLIPIASLASLFILDEGDLLQHLSRGWLTTLAAGWCAILLWGMWHASPGNWQNLDDSDNYPIWFAQTMLIQEENVRAYVATGDPKDLSHYPEATQLTNILSSPKLSRIMPADCRRPLKIEKGDGSDAAFIPDGCPPDRPRQEFAQAWGNDSTNGIQKGHFVSQPLTTQLPKLELQLCCAPDANNIDIKLVEQTSGRQFPVVPQITGQWHTVILDSPRGPFHLEITDQSTNSWVAVGDLKESGRLSVYARLLTAHAILILLAGLSLFVCCAGYDTIRGAAGLHRHPAIRWLSLLAVAITLAGVWCNRNFNVTNLHSELYANCAKTEAEAGHAPQAVRLLREALWLQPDNKKLKEQLRALSEPIVNGHR